MSIDYYDASLTQVMRAFLHDTRLSLIPYTGLISTTFANVHLPPKTIDSVRTIVSLPLLYPSAFKQGILKEHALTGCLLFGPPGTGKTLVVRALAKEAGCRMLAVSPSDVMDMVSLTVRSSICALTNVFCSMSEKVRNSSAPSSPLPGGCRPAWCLSTRLTRSSEHDRPPVNPGEPLRTEGFSLSSCRRWTG